MAESRHVGQRVSYSGALCTVRYVGRVEGTKGSWLGVEWDDATRGKHDGSHKGVRYFTCESRRPTPRIEAVAGAADTHPPQASQSRPPRRRLCARRGPQTRRRASSPRCTTSTSPTIRRAVKMARHWSRLGRLSSRARWPRRRASTRSAASSPRWESSRL